MVVGLQVAGLLIRGGHSSTQKLVFVVIVELCFVVLLFGATSTA